jgi:hypothetical protein
MVTLVIEFFNSPLLHEQIVSDCMDMLGVEADSQTLGRPLDRR